MTPWLATLAATALLAAAVVPTPARAIEFKVYHGSDCKVFGSTAWTDLSFSGYGVRNLATSARNIICPIIKDSEAVWNGLSSAGADMTLTLETGGVPSSFSCTAYVTSVYGGTASNTYAISSGGQIPANTLISFTTASWFQTASTVPNIVSDQAYVLCTLGPGVRLRGYSVQERAITD